eukprot:INCI12357.1.p1 GENE.INCI12357.1~~INCI12357.1.p1  ORF type:complete len:337 (+),score=72.69 INCI12357.1:270-1280(+)
MASLLIRAASGFGRRAVASGLARRCPTQVAAGRNALFAPSQRVAAVPCNAFGDTATAEQEAGDLPSNLVFDDFEELMEEPETFDDALLLRADNSEKIMPVIFLSSDGDTEEAAEDNDAEAEDPAASGDSSSGRSQAQEVAVLDNRVFGVPIRRDIVHRVVVWQRARWRKGTAHTRTRAEVSGGGKKPWAQKGSGRARHGSTRSPIWRGGGKAHGKKQRDFSFKLNRKVRQLGMRVALAAKWREGNLFIVDVDGVESHRTGDFLAALDDHEIYEEDGSVMLVDGDDLNDNVATAARNLPWFSVYPQRGANVYAILKHHRLFVTRTALEELTERLTRH